MKSFQKFFYIFGSSIFTLFIVFAILVATNVVNIDDVNKILSNSPQTDVIEEIRDNLESNDSGIQKVSRKMNYEDYLSKAEELKSQGFLNLAIEQYLKANEERPNKLEPLLEIGKIKYQQKDFTTAQELFSQASSKDNSNQETLIWIGKTFIKQRDFQNAQKTFNSIDTPSAEALFFKGAIESYFKNYQEGIDSFNTVISFGESEFSEKSQIYINAYNEFNLSQDGQTPHLDALLSRAFNQTELYEFTIATLFETLKIEPRYRDAWILLGHSYLKLEKFQEAVDTLEEAKRLDPNKPETLYFLGLAHFGNENLQDAINSLELSLTNGFQPEIQAHQKLAEYYLQSENYLDAIESYNKVIEINGTNINYYIRPMWIYIEALNKPADALELANKGLAENPDEAMSFNLLGWAYIANNELEKAKANLDTALSIDPNLAAAYLNYGQYYEAIEELEKAKDNYRKAHDLGKGDPISNMAAQKYNDLVKKENQEE